MTFYWLYSDGETVREISWEKWQQIANKDWGRETNTHLICDVCNGEIHLIKGGNFISIPLAQLKTVLASRGVDE